MRGDLFFNSLIDGYAANARAVRREWLERRIHDMLGDTNRPFVLITGEPGAGKSAVLASLASQNPGWPRHFIRRDRIAPLGTPGARSFLFQIGLHLAALHRDVFTREHIQVTVEQRIARVAHGARVIGAEVNELVTSPFVTAALQIRQQVEDAGGEVIGLRIDRWIAEPRLIPLEDLQYLALIDPATTLARQHPEARIVVLIDALDELRFQPQDDSLLDWLANCPDLPGNVHLVITRVGRTKPCCDRFGPARSRASSLAGRGDHQSTRTVRARAAKARTGRGRERSGQVPVV